MGALALYLFYNGSTYFNNLVPSDFGMSITHAQRIIDFRLTQYRNGIVAPIPRPVFNDFYPYSFPFSHLFCDCDTDFNKPIPISGSDIYRGFPYQRISPDVHPQTDEDFRSSQNILLDEVKEPLAKYRIIVKRDSSKG